MKPFEYFLNNNEVRKVTPDKELAISLIKDMKERAEKSLLLDVSIFSKIVFENLYDGLRDFCDALLAIDGFKSYSHQASISYLEKKGFEFSTIEILDQFRYKRNSSKYYGKSLTKEDTLEIIKFYKELKSKINKTLLTNNLK